MKMPPGGWTAASAKFDVGEEVNSTLARPTQSDAFTVLMPYPPSANRLVRHTRAGHYHSAAYKHWQREADTFLQIQMANGLKLPTPPLAEVAVETRLHPPDKRRRDLDNFGAKAVLDKLVAWQVITDDSQVQRIVMLWDCENLSPGSVVVTIREVSP